MTSPTPSRIRYATPDIARGIALLGIALANISTAWILTTDASYAEHFGGVYGQGSVLENLAVVFSAMFVHVRGLPMFTTLLGFGVGLITMSLWRRNYPLPRARTVLLRRYGLLAVFGLVHLVLLFFGDIMVSYGLGAMVLATMISLKDRTLMIIAWVLIGIQIAFTTAGAVVMALVPDLMAFGLGDIADNSSYLGYLRTNLVVGGSQLMALPVTVGMLLPLMIIGFVWARRGVLADLDAHATLLRRWVAVTVAVILLVGLPWGLAAVGVLPGNLEAFFSVLNGGVGMLTGPGILAAFALACRGIQERIDAGSYRPSVPVRAVTALGRRSMSGYIMQSFLFLVLTQPFTLGWGIGSGVLTQMGIAFLVWLITLVLAYVGDLAGWPGPLEWLHRRLAYGRGGL